MTRTQLRQLREVKDKLNTAALLTIQSLQVSKRSRDPDQIERALRYMERVVNDIEEIGQ